MISRRSLLGGAAAMTATVAATGLSGCASGSGPRLLAYDGPPVTGVVLNKAARRLYLLSGGATLKAYDVELGSNPVGPKRMEGDGRTPEGAYVISRHNPRSQYYLSVGISYPDAQDRARAAAMGVRPGGDIMIHGTPREKRGQRDWTAGCIAVENREIEEVFAMLRVGTPVTIHP